MAKILTARQAVDTYFYDGATVTFGGFANGLMHPEEIMLRWRRPPGAVDTREG